MKFFLKIYFMISKLEKLGFDVAIDSGYEPGVKPYMVMHQVPDPASIVKNGRTIFLTLNKAQPPVTPMPKLIDLSYRSALMILKSSRLILADTVHKPNYANGAVLDQLYRGVSIQAGAMLPQGSRISLVIGDGLGNVDLNVPDVIGVSPEEGIATLNGYGLFPVVIWDEPITDSGTAVIYTQTPSPYDELDAPNRIREGDQIDIRIKQSPTPEELEDNRRPSRGVNKDDSSAPPVTPRY
jgi:beta-lactam-binding protein with PASTA domain